MIDVMEQSKIPTRELYSGEKIPCVGLGTFGSDKYGADAVSEAVYGAVKYGYRLIDCASVYQNEVRSDRCSTGFLKKKWYRDRIYSLPPRSGMICTGRDRLWNPAVRV